MGFHFPNEARSKNKYVLFSVGRSCRSKEPTVICPAVHMMSNASNATNVVCLSHGKNGCLENEDRRPKTKDLEKEDPLENEDLENEDPLEKHENTKQKIEAESSLAYLQISKMAETWPGAFRGTFHDSATLVTQEDCIFFSDLFAVRHRTILPIYFHNLETI